MKMPEYGPTLKFIANGDGYVLVIYPSQHVIEASGATMKKLDISAETYGVITRWSAGLGPAPVIADLLVTGMDENEFDRYINVEILREKLRPKAL